MGGSASKPWLRSSAMAFQAWAAGAGKSPSRSPISCTVSKSL